MKKVDLSTRDITYMAIGIAAMIVGGFVIYQISMVLPIPGVKYILMSPYLSMVIFMILSKVRQNYAMLKFGCVFGFIMCIINVFMGASILLTAFLTQGSMLAVKGHDKQVLIGAILFSGYAGFSALAISKYLIGGVFREIPDIWLFNTGILCLGFGAIGTVFATKVMKHLNMYSYRQ